MLSPPILVACFVLVIATTADGANSCVVSPTDRVDCGYGGIGRARCVARGCCHDTSIRNVIWCFYGKGGKATALKGSCPVPPNERVECGYAGISRQTCEGRGCCFDSSIRNTKWCFEKDYKKVPASSLYQKTFNMMYEETPDQGLTSGWSNSYANPGQPSSLSNAPHAFRFVPCFGGITGDYGALESVAHPGHYLRHYGYVIYLKRMTNSEKSSPGIASKDACFSVENSLTSPGHIIFRSFNYRNHVLARRQDGKIAIDNRMPNRGWVLQDTSSSLYQKTFNMMYEETPDQGLRAAWSNSYGIPGQPTSLSNDPTAFRFVPCFGGITGDYGALESVAHRGHYLRHYGYVIYLKRMTNSELTKPGIASKDACFSVEDSKTAPGHVIFRSYNYRNHVLARRQDGKIAIVNKKPDRGWLLEDEEDCD